MNYYSTTYAYQSRFSKQLFESESEARAFDRSFVAHQLAELSAPEFESAFSSEGSDRGVEELLRFAASELPHRAEKSA